MKVTSAHLGNDNEFIIKEYWDILEMLKPWKLPLKVDYIILLRRPVVDMQRGVLVYQFLDTLLDMIILLITFMSTNYYLLSSRTDMNSFKIFHFLLLRAKHFEVLMIELRKRKVHLVSITSNFNSFNLFSMIQSS